MGKNYEQNKWHTYTREGQDEEHDNIYFMERDAHHFFNILWLRGFILLTRAPKHS